MLVLPSDLELLYTTALGRKLGNSTSVSVTLVGASSTHFLTIQDLSLAPRSAVRPCPVAGFALSPPSVSMGNLDSPILMGQLSPRSEVVDTEVTSNHAMRFQTGPVLFSKKEAESLPSSLVNVMMIVSS